MFEDELFKDHDEVSAFRGLIVPGPGCRGRDLGIFGEGVFGDVSFSAIVLSPPGHIYIVRYRSFSFHVGPTHTCETIAQSCLVPETLLLEMNPKKLSPEICKVGAPLKVTGDTLCCDVLKREAHTFGTFGSRRGVPECPDSDSRHFLFQPKAWWLQPLVCPSSTLRFFEGFRPTA